jgi:single-stranded DNA-binding protein
MTSQRTLQITVFGNLGAAPETRILKGQSSTKEVYDPVLADAVVREINTPDREIRTASLAVNGRDEEGGKITNWHRLVDFNGHLADYSKGDRLKVHGYFRDRTYLKDGERKTIRELIVLEAQLEKRRDQAA